MSYNAATTHGNVQNTLLTGSNLGSIVNPGQNMMLPSTGTSMLQSSVGARQNFQQSLPEIPVPALSLPTERSSTAQHWNPFDDPWPQGDFEQNFTDAEYTATKSLGVGWANDSGSGSRGGDPNALDPFKGKLRRRKCLGVILCTKGSCDTRITPKTRQRGREDQVNHVCHMCGGRMQQFTCTVVTSIYRWSGGWYYVNGGTHKHEKPHRRSMTIQEHTKLTKIIEEHPTATTAQLRVGLPQLHGTGPPISNISEVLHNGDRVTYERRKVLATGPFRGGDDTMAALDEFGKEYPGFIKYSSLVPPLIVMQSDFMMAQALNVLLEKEEPINGFVADAAHKFWRSRALLVITSCYSATLLRWVPVVITFSTGGTAEHFKEHFLVLFRGMARELRARGLKLLDSHCRCVSHLHTWL